MNYVIASEKQWNKNLSDLLKKQFPSDNFFFITQKQDFTFEKLSEISPKYVFIPHWSYIIPAKIYENFECIVFHMTDLPYGRGGSPLQNLIIRGIKTTKISALRVVKELDAGDIYLKKDLQLCGTAEEIYIAANKIIGKMIVEIIEQNPKPCPQQGEPVIFKRRKPEQSNIKEIETIEKLYDFIRMLDAEGYPKAFYETEFFRLEFSRASLKSNNSIIADVRIIKKQ